MSPTALLHVIRKLSLAAETVQFSIRGVMKQTQDLGLFCFVFFPCDSGFCQRQPWPHHGAMLQFPD